MVPADLGIPPPLPKAPRPAMGRKARLLIGISFILTSAVILLRLCGFIRLFSVPTSGMDPEIAARDHVIMEGVTFLFRQPRRGDIVVFKTDGIVSGSPAQIYIKRVAGESGEHVRISEGKLFVNDRQILLSNTAGQIVYDLPPNGGDWFPHTDLIVSTNSYFVLGDNSTNSFDSRVWGPVPRRNVLGRVAFCYWPPQRAGRLK